MTKIASESTAQVTAEQLQKIKTEIRRIRGLSKFTAGLIIREAKSRGIDLVENALDEFTESSAKVYLLIDGHKTSTDIGKDLGISQQAAHQQLQNLIRMGYVDRQKPRSKNIIFRKSEVEDVLGLSRKLIKKFDLSKWRKTFK